MREFLTDEQRIAIGDVTAESAWMEEVVKMTISVFAGMSDERLEVFLGGRMIDAKLQILEGLAATDAVRPDKREGLLRLVASLRDLNAHRVTVVHGMWEPEGGAFSLANLANGRPFADVVRFRKRGKERILSTAEVIALADQIGTATHALLNFAVQELMLRDDETKAEGRGDA